MTDDPKDESLEGLIGQSFVERGELVPTTTEQVLDTASDDDVELPESLANLYSDVPGGAEFAIEAKGGKPAANASLKTKVEPAPIATVTPIRPLRAIGYLAACAAGVAAIWLGTRFTRDSTIVGDDARSVVPPAGSAPPREEPVMIVPPTCAADCCGGARCGAAATGDLATCPTERTCIPCEGLDAADSLYRVRIGDPLLAEPNMSPDSLDQLDICVKVGTTGIESWSCEPAHLPSSVRPRGRFLRTASRAIDLASGVSVELRIRGKSTAYGRWTTSVHVGAASLCKGYRVVLTNDKSETVATLSMFLERTYYVELARRDSEAALADITERFDFGVRQPQRIRSGGAHVLAIGPFDRAEATRLLDQVRVQTPSSLVEGLRIDTGDGYDAW